MKQQAGNINNYSPSLKVKIREWLFRWIRLTSRPAVKVYHGYGAREHLVVFGHVFKVSPLPRRRYRKNIWTNTLALIRLFMVRPYPVVSIQLHFGETVLDGVTEKDGFFRFHWKPDVMPAPGWHKVDVFITAIPGMTRIPHSVGSGEIYVPYNNKYAIISDIDDTFLISHSSNLRKRLYVLLTKNAHSRMPFDGVVKHYQRLAYAGTTPEKPNSFFYISSSEWNLYDYIREFTRKNELPKGVYLLNQLKVLSQAFSTGQNNHATKFTRISRVLEAFPDQQFILMGDDSQQDPVIYAAVAEHFPQQIRAVYLRNVFAKNKAVVRSSVRRIKAAGIPVCHFRHSGDAMLHSVKIGLLDTL